MVSDTIIASLITVVGGLITASIVGVIGYLGKAKVDRIFERLDDLEQQIEEEKQEREEDHQVVENLLIDIAMVVSENHDEVDIIDDIDSTRTIVNDEMD